MSHANEQASCLCCGKPGEPGAWLMDDQKVYVCRRCHRLGNTPEFKAASEEEGDAYAHGFFDGVDHDKEQRDELKKAAKGKVGVTLTGKEIREIAELAGLQIVEHDYADEYETEITVEAPSGFLMGDDGEEEHYRLIAYLTEDPDEGAIGLGEKIEAPAIASVKCGAA